MSLEGISQSSYADYAASQKTEFYREDFNGEDTTWETYESGVRMGKIHDGYFDISYLEKREMGTQSAGYFIVMTKGNAFTDQGYRATTAFLEEEIKKGWDDGYSISNLSYVNEEWILLLSKGTGFSTQKFHTRTEFPETEIKEGWDEEYSISELTYGNGVWALVLSKTSDLSAQQVATSATFPEEKIKEYIKSGHFISEVTYGNDRWALVGAKDTRIRDQEWFKTGEYPLREIEYMTNRGYSISILENHNDSWVLIMNKTFENLKSVWFSNDTWPKGEIKKYWDQDYYLTDIAYYEENNQSTQTEELLADLLVGTWYGGAADEEQGQFIFDRDRTVTMITEGDTLGGKGYVMNGVAFNLKYEINSSSSPKGIDIVFYSAGDNLGSMKGIIRMINEDQIEMKLSSIGEARPTEMKNESDSKVAVFKRVK